MKRVDLALAVNYVPACVCLCKALVLMLALALIPAGEEVRGGYIPLAAMLYLDRLVVRNMIFDANAILLALYFANVHAAAAGQILLVYAPDGGTQLEFVSMSLLPVSR